MVLLTTTLAILHAQTTLSPSSPLNNDTTQPSISHTDLIQLSRQTKISLNTLLRGTKPYYAPPKPPTPKSPEYVALMTRLKAEQEAREYRLLLLKQSQEQAQDTAEEGEDDISPSLVLNMLLSVVMCAWVAFYTTKWLFSDGVRVLCSLGTGVVVGVAEVAVYAAYLRKVGEARRKERGKKEVKTVLGEYIGEEGVVAWGVDRADKVVELDTREVEKSEQVWGRGVHGGVRRRIREKWEHEQKEQER